MRASRPWTWTPRAAPGVVDVITGAELAEAGVNNMACGIRLKNRDGTPRAEPGRPLLATDRVRYAGDNLALAVARSAARARGRPGAAWRHAPGHAGYAPVPVAGAGGDRPLRGGRKGFPAAAGKRSRHGGHERHASSRGRGGR